MTTQEINNAYKRITAYLDQRELKDAFDALQGLIAGSRQYELQDKLDELQSTYKYMLKYRLEGIADPMQGQILRTLFASAYRLASCVRQKALAKDSAAVYYSKQKMVQRDGREKDLFLWIWTTPYFTAEDTEWLRSRLKDNQTGKMEKCVVVSALWLALQEVFDEEKVCLLFDALETEDKEVHIRALVSLLLALYFYRQRTELYPQIENRLQALAEAHPELPKEIQNITLRFILSRETEKITRRLQNEIIPEMIKLNPNLSRKINLKDLNPEQPGDEMNPEWQEKIFANQELSKMMMEFSELQMEGADVLHSTFVHMKNFPFFSDLKNWFLPFDIDHPSLRKIENPQEKAAIELMMKTGFICNSDKYSLYLGIQDIPEEYRKMMMANFDNQAAEMYQQRKGEIYTTEEERKMLAALYVQDLYRFYKLYPKRSEFTDIFSYPLDFHNLPILQPYISNTESLTAIAEYYLQKKYFTDALQIYKRLATMEPDSEIVFQKIGYCKQMEDDLEGALQAYLQADLLNTNSKWVIRRIANCYRALKQPKKALEYYHRYETLDPDNLSVQISIGHCHLELKDYNEALKYYYKVDYLDPKSQKAWRPIAWCSFLTGKYNQARKYYNKILSSSPNRQDYLNAGHTEWVLKNTTDAVDFYKKAVVAEDGDFAKFKEQFCQDIPDLEKAGIKREEIPLFLDLLKYAVDEDLN